MLLVVSYRIVCHYLKNNNLLNVLDIVSGNVPLMNKVFLKLLYTRWMFNKYIKRACAQRFSLTKCQRTTFLSDEEPTHNVSL